MSAYVWSSARRASAATRPGVPRVWPRIALSLYAGIAIYCILSIFLGSASLAAYRRLEEREAVMRANLADLEAIRGRLSAELESLKSDPDRIALEARGLGYLRKGETAVVLGERLEKVEAFDTGSVLPYAEQSAFDDATAKQIAAGSCLALMAALCTLRFPSRSRKPGNRD